MKKIISSIVAMTLCTGICINGLYTKTAYAYENIIEEVRQIRSYIDGKLYLEAARLCDETSSKYYLSNEDKNLLNEYKRNAESAYMAYLEDMKRSRTQQFYISDWCLGYQFFSAHPPKHENDWDVGIYNNGDDHIYIESFLAGEYYYYNKQIKKPAQYVSEFARSYRDYFHDCSDEGRPANVEIISENDTVVGGLPARQVTLRTSIDLNRYGTIKEYCLIRCTAFQFGDWIYVIKAYRSDYSWGDDFWNKMELLRNSISFY